LSDPVVIPAISVIIPCWNAEATIARALDSVLSEQGVDVECVVVDDGSEDRTADVVASIAGRDSRVVLLRAPTNGGASSARNRGLDAARGSWLTFLDADDRLLPGGLAAMAEPAVHGDVLAVIGQRVWTDGQRTWISRFYDIPDIRTPGRASLSSRPGLLYYASATGKLIHRSCTDGLRFHGRVLGDQPWTIRALLRAGDRVEVIPDDVYEWSRPPKGEFRPTITALTRSSARLGVEAAAVAAGALSEVSAEAHAQIADPEARRNVTRHYLERLLRSDLGVHLARALARRDPTTSELLDSLARFVGAVPAGLVAGQRAMTDELLVPPLRAWRRLDRPARRAYWRLARAAADADPAVVRSITPRQDALALRWALSAPGWLGPPLLGLLKRAVRSAARVRARRARKAGKVSSSR
jgi:hypothetical protein